MYFEEHFHSEQAEWILFIHGLGGSTRTWKYQLEDFRDFNVICIDLDGHGQTAYAPSRNSSPLTRSAISIHQLIEEKHIDNVHIIAMSLGTIVALEYALLYADQVSSLVLAGCVVNLEPWSRFLLMCANILKRFMPVRLTYTMFAQIIMPKASHKQSRQIFIRESGKMESAAFRQWVSAMYVSRRRLEQYVDALRTHRIRVLFISGSEDYLFLAGIRRLCSAVSAFSLQTIPHCGHVCSIEKSSEFNRIARRFIAETDEQIGWQMLPNRRKHYIVLK